MATTTKPPMTNGEFGRRTGYTHSMASRIRAGQRLPGVDGLYRISAAFDIPIKTLLDARHAGPEEFSALLRKRVFKDPQPA